MNKILTLFFFTIVGLVCAQSNAYARMISLNPHESKSLTNNSFGILHATCVVQNVHQKSSKIKINVLKNSGTVNGRRLSTGQGTLIQVRNNGSVSVSAESGTKINLINLGAGALQASCSV
jgi:hypothetical protein